MKLFCSGKRVTTPTIFQMEATECGAACLAMVLAYHGCHEPLEKLREACGVSRNGSVASLILRAAGRYKLSGRGYKMPADRLLDLPLPAVLFWDFEHFVVFEGRRGDYFYINDPAQGPLRFAKEDFEKRYTGVALSFEPEADFIQYGKRRGLWATLWPMLTQVKSAVTGIGWAGLLLVIPGLLIPSMLQIFIDEVLDDKSDWLYPLLLALGFTAAAQALLIWLQQLAFRRGEVKLGAENTLRILERFFTLPIDFFMQRSTADLQHRASLASETATSIFEYVAENGIKCVTATFFLLLMFQLNVFLSLAAVVSVALEVMAITLISRYRQVLNQSLMMIETRLTSLSMTGIAMMESLRAGGREDGFFSEWSSCLAEYTDKSQHMQYSTTLFSAFPDLLAGLNAVLILCFGAWRIMEGDMTLGTMMAFTALMAAFIAPVNDLVNAGAAIQELKGAVDRIDDVFHYLPEQRFRGENADAHSSEFTPEPLEEPLKCAGKLELRNITFGYNRFDNPLIENFSLVLEPGRSIALVGESGSGKSTLAKLAGGLYLPWSGQILLDDRPVEECTRAFFNSAISMVDQNILLFSGTVRDNLTLYQNRYNTKRLHEALLDAALSDELAQRRGASELDTPVEEMGSNFSGGQRQRMEIARIFARKTPIVILDEATSALDAATERLIYKAVRRQGSSCLVIAHRLSTIRHCDEILVLDKGKVCERGSHDDLMALDGQYAKLMRMQ